MACEAVLMMSSRSFVDMGQAPATIHKNKLYRVEFESFEDYCGVKWRFARRHPYQLTDSMNLVEHSQAKFRPETNRWEYTATAENRADVWSIVVTAVRQIRA